MAKRQKAAHVKSLFSVPKNVLTSEKGKRLFVLSSGFDMPFFILLILVLAVGLICLFSASFAYSYYRNNGDSYHYIKRQLLYALAGLVVMFVASAVDYHRLRRWAWWVMFGSWGALLLVLVLPAIQNVHRWIRLGPIHIQPSEIAKFGIILLFAHLISQYQQNMKDPRRGFWPFMGILGITCGLIVIEPHLSGTILLFAIGMVMLFIGGTQWRYLGLVLGIAAVGAVVMVVFLGYEQDRIDVWLDPIGVYTSDVVYESGQTGRDAAWQTVQSLFAIGSGGLMGEGLGNSRQKHSFLPEPQNDFIFSIVCEELGFVGAILIIALFAALVWRGFVIGMRAPDKFGSMLAIGLIAQVGIQVVFNLAVVTNSFPNTGISLPFFSYGGSSLIMLLAQMGVILSISRQSKTGRQLTVRILMVGGGTAGHINPAIAIADMMKDKHPDSEILFVGVKGKMETSLVPRAGYALKTVTVQGFKRSFSPKAIAHNVAAMVHAMTAGGEARRIIREFKPDIAIGTGGYVCGPVLREAARMGVPVVLHESNALPGVTVKLLATAAKAVMVGDEAARKHLPDGAHVVVTGNPLRRSFSAMDRTTARQELGVDDRPLVLSFGGSLGARHLNEAVAGVLQRNAQEQEIQFIVGTGKGENYERMQTLLAQYGVKPDGVQVRVRDYIDDMPRCMAAADLVISRCGAMTISELPAMRKPSILIPSPYVAENHQYHNAMTLVNRGAAVCIEEKDLTAERLWDTIKETVLDPAALAAMSNAAGDAAVLDADERIYAVIRDVLGA